MIFTIGHTASYLNAIANSPDGKIQKTGRIEPGENDDFPNGYIGGYAFESAKDAQRRIDEAYPDRQFGVFGLDADWEKDTIPNPDGGWWHNLINDSDIIVLNR